MVRPNFKRSIPLVGCVAEMLDLRRTSVRLLEVISGSFVSVFQFRRRLMCPLSEVYSAQAGRQPTDIISISPELHQELLIACLLVPTAFLDVRAPAAPLLVASDASTAARASVCCSLPAAASEECYRHTLQRGLWSRLLRPLPAYLRSRGQLPADQELPAEHYKSHPLWQTICENLRFRHLVRARSNRGSRHINILELKAALEAEAYVGKLHPFTRYVHLVDSQVAAASLVKGRSSSIGINKLLKGSLVPLRQPEGPPPSWFASFLSGDLSGFDGFLRSFGLDRFSLSDLPPATKLLEPLSVDRALTGAGRSKAVPQPLQSPCGRFPLRARLGLFLAMQSQALSTPGSVLLLALQCRLGLRLDAFCRDLPLNRACS